MRGSLLLSAAAVLLAAAPVEAQRIVYYTDSNQGTSVLPAAITALQALRGGVTADLAQSQAAFNSALASGSYDLAIFGEQGGNVFAGSQAALTSFLAGGGRVIGATWLDGGFRQLLGATSRASTNGTSISGSGALFAGISSPVGIANPGGSWGIYSSGFNGAAGTQCLATLSSGGCAALLGAGGNTMLYGPLFDTYSDAAQGAQFVANGADLLLGPTSTVPEPSTYALLGSGLALLGGVAARRKRTAA